MRKKNRFTIEEYLEIAEDLDTIRSLFRKFSNKCTESYSKSSPLSKIMGKFANDYMLRLETVLNNEFHKAIDDDKWVKLNIK